MSDYQHIVAHVRDTPWAILPAKLVAILDFISIKAAGGNLTAEEIEQRIGAGRRPTARTAGAIAVLPLYGVISQRMNMMSAASGGTSIEQFTSGFRSALADPQVGAIVLDVDSPGGSVQGVAELADEIHRGGRQKQIIAVANSMSASAAYWIGSAANELVVTPSGEVGSIGVLAAHQDVSEAQEKIGVKTSLVSAGKYKTEGNPFEPLTDEARAYIQARVDEHYGMFLKSVATQRKVSLDTVRDGFGQGRMVGAKAAVKLGMADSIGTLDETIARLSKGEKPRRMGREARERRMRMAAQA
jgi:signal peptide peptidase SppA